MEKAKKHRPLIAISIGDINGIGPEVAVKTFADNRMLRVCTPIIYASAKLLQETAANLGLTGMSFISVADAGEAKPKQINVVQAWDEEPEQQLGQATASAGKAAWKSLQKATEDLRAKKVDALVTAPINKDTVQSDDFKFPGHTEYLTEAFGIGESLMLLTYGNLRVGVATGHIPLKSVAEALNKDLLKRKTDIMERSLRSDFGIAKPRIAILGLNPHAGENGLLGREELSLIKPLIEDFKSKGKLVFGPYPADGFFGNGLHHKFDGILAMYHDQGLIPFKTIAFSNGVNFTAGLPAIRTSPDHGTAFDIAGKGIADETSMRQAVYVACDIASHRMAEAEILAEREPMPSKKKIAKPPQKKGVPQDRP